MFSGSLKPAHKKKKAAVTIFPFIYLFLGLFESFFLNIFIYYVSNKHYFPRETKYSQFHNNYGAITQDDKRRYTPKSLVEKYDSLSHRHLSSHPFCAIALSRRPPVFCATRCTRKNAAGFTILLCISEWLTSGV